jgi:1-acyl-sn-glycerol-3-phosphate acyltransferase
MMLENKSNIIKRLCITLYFWLLIVITNIIAGSILLIEILLQLNIYNQNHVRYIIENIIAKNCINLMVFANLWSVEYIDNRTDKININEKYIIVCNHLSIIDTIFTSQLPFDKIYTWKKKWAYTPIFGQLCLLGGHITIDTNDILSRQNAIQQSIKCLESELSVLFYPEGTRNKIPNTLMPFKTGAFRVAKETSVKILPVTIMGTDQGCNGFICDVAKIKIIIDDPITVVDIDTAITEVREIMMNNFQSDIEISRKINNYINLLKIE